MGSRCKPTNTMISTNIGRFESYDCVGIPVSSISSQSYVMLTANTVGVVQHQGTGCVTLTRRDGSTSITQKHASSPTMTYDSQRFWTLSKDTSLHIHFPTYQKTWNSSCLITPRQTSTFSHSLSITTLAWLGTIRRM